MAKAKRVERTRMSEADVEKYLKHFAKSHDLRGKEFDHAIRRCAATRWAALERNAKGRSKRVTKAASKKPRSAKSSKRK